MFIRTARGARERRVLSSAAARLFESREGRARMAKQVRTRQSVPRPRDSQPAANAPEVARRHRQGRFDLTKYQEFGSKLTLGKQFAELLWSFPFPTEFPL